MWSRSTPWTPLCNPTFPHTLRQMREYYLNYGNDWPAASRGEQFGSESLGTICHAKWAGIYDERFSHPVTEQPPSNSRKSEGPLMDSILRRFRDRFRRRVAYATGRFTDLLAGLKPPSQDYGTQRMCPFCGLITPRSKRLCLECG